MRWQEKPAHNTDIVNGYHSGSQKAKVLENWGIVYGIAVVRFKHMVQSEEKGIFAFECTGR